MIDGNAGIGIGISNEKLMSISGIGITGRRGRSGGNLIDGSAGIGIGISNEKLRSIDGIGMIGRRGSAGGNFIDGSAGIGIGISNPQNVFSVATSHLQMLIPGAHGNGVPIATAGIPTIGGTCASPNVGIMPPMFNVAHRR